MRDKLLSGRWLMTIGATLSMLAMVISDCIVACSGASTPLPFSPEAIFAVIAAVTTFYFSKPPEVQPPKAP